MIDLYDLLTSPSHDNIILAYTMRHRWSREEWWAAINKMTVGADTNAIGRSFFYPLGEGRYWHILEHGRTIYLWFNTIGSFRFEPIAELQYNLENKLVLKRKGKSQLKKMFGRIKIALRIPDSYE